MIASRAFKLKRGRGDDWFNVVLDADTKLFVDPFLVFQDTTELWRSAHETIIQHFDHAFRLIAEGNLNPESLPYLKALRILEFKEPKELCLGYTERGTAGSGSGKLLAKQIAKGIVAAIERGLKHPRHFEELGILNEGIGADRISDITCTILKRRLVEYTQSVASRHGLKVQRHRLYAAGFDEQRLRWETSATPTVTNPANGRPLLFVPNRFLRDLPVLNAYDWWDDYQNEQLRQDVNYEIMRGVDKATIVSAARRDPEAVRNWTIAKEAEVAQPYDLERDRLGRYLWDPATEDYVAAHPLRLKVPTSPAEFVGVIQTVIKQFTLYVEEERGWSLLWDTGNTHEKPEEAAQLLFKGIAKHYCRANDIVVDREVELGRGPVDFKFSSGYQQRAHLEVKKLQNGHFWHGLDDQLPTYMKGDEVVMAWYLVLQYRADGVSRSRLRDLPGRVASAAKRWKVELRHAIVDARPKASASKA